MLDTLAILDPQCLLIPSFILNVCHGWHEQMQRELVGKGKSLVHVLILTAAPPEPCPAAFPFARLSSNSILFRQPRVTTLALCTHGLMLTLYYYPLLTLTHTYLFLWPNCGFLKGGDCLMIRFGPQWLVKCPNSLLLGFFVTNRRATVAVRTSAAFSGHLQTGEPSPQDWVWGKGTACTFSTSFLLYPGVNTTLRIIFGKVM